MIGDELHSVGSRVAAASTIRRFLHQKGGVARGEYRDLCFLDTDPLQAKVGADPRYLRVHAPTRMKATA